MENSSQPNKIDFEKNLCFLLLFPLTALLLVVTVYSLQWRMVHDSPILYYSAFLIDKFNFVPYKDIFENSFPGTFLLHLCLGKIFGYSDLAFRVVDILWLLLLSILTWSLLKHFGKYTAWAGAVLFPLIYFSYGPYMSFERDYIGILPVAAAIYAAAFPTSLSKTKRSFLAGTLFGVAAMIKPHLCLGAPFVILYIVCADFQKMDAKTVVSNLKSGILNVLVSLAGFMIITFASFFWIWLRGGWPYFWEMFRSYMPLYQALDGDFISIHGMDRLLTQLKFYRSAVGNYIWLTLAYFGIYIAIFEGTLSTRQKRLVVLLAVLIFIYSIYPVIAGKFFNYHWIPFIYFVTISTSLLLIQRPKNNSIYKRLFPVCLLIFSVLISINPPKEFWLQIKGLPPPSPQEGRVDEIAEFLIEQLNPGDTVQPLDFIAGGAIQAMLIAEAKIATPYLHDIQFYLDPTDPYVQLIRRRFIEDLKREKPRFIIDVKAKYTVSGDDTAKDFPELTNFVNSNYTLVLKGSGYFILEREHVSSP